jgi:U3 small nucleolar ribonucleoprotein component
LIKRRVLDDMFDDRTRLEIAPGFNEHFTSLPDVSVEKSKHSLGELYEMDFTNSLGMKTNKEER